MGQYYYPREPEEPSGCAQTVVITRVIFGILAGPLAVLAAAMGLMIGTLVLFTINPLLALIPIGIGAGGIVAFFRWEQKRIERDIPKDDPS